jgi:sugar phosphate isomerase/epimerase
MKLGLSVSTFPTKFGPIVYSSSSLEELDLILYKVSRFGYDGVDLFIDPTTESKAIEIKKIFDKYHLDIAMLICIYLADMGVNLSSLDESQRKKSVQIYSDQFKIAKILGAKLMPIGFIRGRIDVADDKASYEQRLALSLTELVKSAKEYGITLCIEPINRYEINTLMGLDEVADFIRKQNLQDIKILPDLFHMNIEDKDLAKSLRNAGTMVAHMHVPDSNRKAPGWGHTDYVSILKVLIDINYQGFLTIEAMPFGKEDECAVQGTTYLKSLLENLKGKTK